MLETAKVSQPRDQRKHSADFIVTTNMNFVWPAENSNVRLCLFHEIETEEFDFQRFQQNPNNVLVRYIYVCLIVLTSEFV